jgi:hypothetical protein
MSFSDIQKANRENRYLILPRVKLQARGGQFVC